MINNLVEQVLRENIPVKFEGRDVHPRNSDKALLIRVWAKQGLVLDYHQTQKLFNAASSETIRRIRQKIQEKGMYQADDRVKQERRFKSYRVQQVAPKATPKYIEQVLF